MKNAFLGYGTAFSQSAAGRKSVGGGSRVPGCFSAAGTRPGLPGATLPEKASENR